MVIIHQFMVANKLVASRQHLGKAMKKLLWQSLLVRLDLNVPLEILPEEKTPLRRAATLLNQYISARATEWKLNGIYTQPSNRAVPVFHECTKAWLRRDWDGVMRDSSRSTAVQQVIPLAANLSESDIARIADRVKAQILPATEQGINQCCGK